MTSASSLPVLQHEGLEAFSPEPVSLATLVASNQSLRWYECVAIVQVICRALAAPSHMAGEGDVGAASVTIDLSGHVAFTGRVQDGHAGVRQLAELLHGILSDDVPVPLRLAISQSLSWPPFYASLSEFSRALAYFERPDQNVIIQNVYHRWEQRQPPEPQRGESEEPTIEEPVHKSPEAQPARAALPRNVVLVTGAAAIVLGFAITAAVIRSKATDIGPQATAADPPRLAVPAVVEITSAADGDVVDQVTLPTAKTPDTPTPTKPVAAAVTDSVRGEVRPAPPVQALRAQPASVSRASEAPPQTPLREAPQPPATVAQPVSAVTPVSTPATIDRATTTTIYSETDTDVAPPVPVYPQFPSVILERAHPDAATFDVVIGRAGSVESVKLRHAPRSVGNAFHLTVSLSAAKAWRFQPAIKDGQPVRYRKTIWLPPTP